MTPYTGIETFDFQILRLTGQLETRYEVVRQDLKHIGKVVVDFESWYQWWFQKAQTYEERGLLEISMTYYRAALFYLSFDDKRKALTYQKYRQCFTDFYSDSGMEYHTVPYQTGELPAVFLPKKQAKKTLLIIGGFDSFMEELVSWFLPFQEELDYNLLLFDGPGQGSVPFQKLYLEAEYETVVTTILDYFDLSEVDAIGISWGGYFVLRAAAFEKRIKKCIAFDIFYSAMDALQLQVSPLEFSLLKLGLALKQKSLINATVKQKIKNNLTLRWMVQHGQNVTGKDNPFDMIKLMSHHHIAPNLDLITQDCLLLAGSQDMYVPSYRLKEMENQLSHARTVRTRLFTRDTGGVLHCQIDQLSVAIAEIRKFLKEPIVLNH